MTFNGLRRWKSAAVTVVLSAALLSACQTPCEQLADAICNCEPDVGAQQSCKTQVASDGVNVKPTAADQKFCTTKLKSCSCERLAAGDRNSCGLTLE